MPRITGDEWDLYFCEWTEDANPYAPLLHVFTCVEARNDFATDPSNFNEYLGARATVLFPEDVERNDYDEIIIHLEW